MKNFQKKSNATSAVIGWPDQISVEDDIIRTESEFVGNPINDIEGVNESWTNSNEYYHDSDGNCFSKVLIDENYEEI